MKRVITPGVTADSDCYEFFKKAVRKENAETITAKSNLVMDLGGGASLSFLFPDRDLSGRSVDTNAASIISPLDYGKTGFLLTADSPQAVEKYIVSLGGDQLDSEVIKVRHHSSKTSTSKAILEFASPHYGVISVGEDDYYGHPDKKVISRLEKFGVEILRTDKKGSIEFFSDGKDLELVDD